VITAKNRTKQGVAFSAFRVFQPLYLILIGLILPCHLPLFSVFLSFRFLFDFHLSANFYLTGTCINQSAGSEILSRSGLKCEAFENQIDQSKSIYTALQKRPFFIFLNNSVKINNNDFNNFSTSNPEKI